MTGEGSLWKNKHFRKPSSRSALPDSGSESWIVLMKAGDLFLQGIQMESLIWRSQMAKAKQDVWRQRFCINIPDNVFVTTSLFKHAVSEPFVVDIKGNYIKWKKKIKNLKKRRNVFFFSYPGYLPRSMSSN